LSLEYYRQNFGAALHAIDDYSIEHISAPKMLDALKRLDLDDIVTVHEGDFRGMSSKPEPNSVPFDFVWFDCGGPAEYVRFLEEYWPLINPDGGILVLHFRYWDIAPNQKPDTPANMVMGSIANEIKRQQAKAGPRRNPRFRL
jgi:predicted O-methyltransferase YrrM